MEILVESNYERASCLQILEAISFLVDQPEINRENQGKKPRGALWGRKAVSLPQAAASQKQSEQGIGKTQKHFQSYTEILQQNMEGPTSPRRLSISSD